MPCHEIPQLQPVYSSVLDPIPTFSSPNGVYVPAAYVSSSSVGTIDNDPDEYDCDSEVYMHHSGYII